MTIAETLYLDVYRNETTLLPLGTVVKFSKKLAEKLELKGKQGERPIYGVVVRNSGSCSRCLLNSISINQSPTGLQCRDYLNCKDLSLKLVSCDKP